LVLHDIVGPAVSKAWRECLEEIPHIGVIELYGKTEPYGIGILVKNG